MLFHVTVKVLGSRSGMQADLERGQSLGSRIQELIVTGRVQQAGFLGGIRGTFFMLEIETPGDLYGLLGPAIYANCSVEAHPVISTEEGAALFQHWAEVGR